MLFLVSFSHHSDVGSWTGRKTTLIRVPTANRIGSEDFPAGGFSSGPGGRRDAGDGGLHSTNSHEERGGVRRLASGRS